MRGTHPLFQTEIFLELHVGPEIDELNALVGRADAINPTETLDDAYGVPMDIVVDQPVTVLEVLAFGDAVRRDQKIDLAFACQVIRPFLGPWREGG